MDEFLRLDQVQIEIMDDAMAEVFRHKTLIERIKIRFNLWTANLASYLSKIQPKRDTARLKILIISRLEQNDWH